MAKAKKLTEASVERIKAGETREEYPDTVVPGLRLVVQTSGRKSWAIRTRLHDQTLKHTIGTYPALPLGGTDKAGTARSEAQRVLNMVGRGIDPRAARKAVERDTVAAVMAEWLERDQKGNKSYANVKRVVEKDVVAEWRDRPITSITRRDCRHLLDKIADRAPVHARRVHSYLHRMFRWAVGRDIVEQSPMADLPKPGKREVSRDRVLDDGELVAVWKMAEAEGWPFGAVVQLLLLTGARKAEINNLTWAEVDDDKLVLDGSRTKTGEPRMIPLSEPAQAIIERLPRMNSPYVFTTNSKTPISGWGLAKRRFDKALGDDVAPWRLHDLRRTTATGLQRLGVRLEVTEAVLGHVSGSRAGIVGVYQRYEFDDEKRTALNTWGRRVISLIEGRENKVVPMR